jgi:Ser/Thr protein kinase RdoA (MazF antagonist)
VFLTEANVLHYLVRRGFARYDAVARGDYGVRNLSRRNRNFRVSTGAQDFLVKQAGEWNHGGRATIEREAVLCRRAHTDAAFEPLRRLVPATHSYDPHGSILIFDFLHGSTPLADSAHHLAPESARAIAAAMADFHRRMSAPGLAQAFPGDAPALLSMHEWDPDDVADRTDGHRELLRLVRRHEAFGVALEALSAAWKPSALIHNDWKVENCLVSDDVFHVIDWELAAWGDPLWDAATFLQSLWNVWVRDPEEQSLEAIRPALRAFLEGYGAPVAPIIAFAGGRMLQSAWESLYKSDHIEGDAVRLAQASLHILTRPDWAREQLLGQ